MNAGPNGANSVRDAWIGRLNDLIGQVEGWARTLDWSTRRIEKRMEDSDLGSYQAPALLLQQETVRVILEPIARQAPGAEGVVDLYLLPAYDDIASLFFVDGEWQLHYMFPEEPTVGDVLESEPIRFDREALTEVLSAMLRNAA